MGEKTGKEYEMMKEWVLVANAKFYYKEFLKSVMSDNVEKLNDNLRHTYKILDDVVLKSKASDFQKNYFPANNIIALGLSEPQIMISLKQELVYPRGDYLPGTTRITPENQSWGLQVMAAIMWPEFHICILLLTRGQLVWK